MTSTARTGGRSSARVYGRAQIELLRVAEGFYDADVLFALNELGVFQALGSDRRSGSELAAVLDAHADSLVRLLVAGVAVGLLDVDDDGTYGAADHCALLLGDPDAVGYLGNWLRFMGNARSQLAGLVESVRTGEPRQELLSGMEDDPERTRDFILAMHDYASVRGSELVRYLDTTDQRTVLDIGAGPGTYSYLLREANPELQLTLLDDPAVLEVAREVAGRYGLADEVTFLAGDARDIELDGQYDLVLLSNVLHALGHEDSRRLLRRLHDAVAPGGSVVIQGQFLAERPGAARWPVMLDLTLLCALGNGRNHTVAQAREWLVDAGFERIEVTEMSILNRNVLVRGFRP